MNSDYKMLKEAYSDNTNKMQEHYLDITDPSNNSTFGIDVSNKNTYVLKTNKKGGTCLMLNTISYQDDLTVTTLFNQSGGVTTSSYETAGYTSNYVKNMSFNKVVKNGKEKTIIY